MRSVRLGDELEQRLEEAARVAGQPVSALIREAVRRRCDEVLGGRLSRRLADVAGAVAGTGGRSRRTGRQFVEALKSSAQRRRKRKP